MMQGWRSKSVFAIEVPGSGGYPEGPGFGAQQDQMKAPMVRAFDWLFRNRETGAITIAQWPNTALWVVIVVSVIDRLWSPTEKIGADLEGIVRGAFFVWTIDEIFRGVNPWRRFLGISVLAYLATVVFL